MVLQETVIRRLRFLAFPPWSHDLVNLVRSLRIPRDRQHQVNVIYERLALYERLESISLIEEALWKMRIDSLHVEIEGTLSDHDRHHLHFRSGASVVIPHVLPYLGRIPDWKNILGISHRSDISHSFLLCNYGFVDFL